MGAPMAGHLIKAGRTVQVWNRTPGRAPELDSHRAPNLDSLGSWADVVFLCIRGTDDVRAVCHDLAGTMCRDTLIVDHSTISPSGAIELHDWLGDRAIRFVDAPITGGSMGAKVGTLTIFCGGDEASIDQVKPILSAYAKRSERVGSKGAGQMMKAANQIAVAGSLLALCESLSFAKKVGLDVVQTREMLSGGAAGSWAFEHYGAKILAGDWSPGFSIDNQLKDLVYAIEAAEESHAAVPGTRLVQQLLGMLQTEGAGDKTTALLYEKMLALTHDHE